MGRVVGTWFIGLALLAGVAPLEAHAQGPQGDRELMRQIPTLNASADNPSSPQARVHTGFEIALSIGVLVFGAVAMGLQILVMLRQNKYWDMLAIKIVGLTLVITAGLFLIVAGYSQEQVAPMMGILGTVVGYLLGKDHAADGAAGPGDPAPKT